MTEFETARSEPDALVPTTQRPQEAFKKDALKESIEPAQKAAVIVVEEFNSFYKRGLGLSKDRNQLYKDFLFCMQKVESRIKADPQIASQLIKGRFLESLKSFFHRNGYFFQPQTIPITNPKTGELYHGLVLSLNRIEKRENVPLAGFFPDHLEFSGSDTATVLYLGGNLISGLECQIKAKWGIDYTFEGTNIEQNRQVIIFLDAIRQKKYPNLEKRIAEVKNNELGHIVFSLIFDGLVNPDQYFLYEVVYKDKKFTLHELSEAFSDLATLVYADEVEFLNVISSGVKSSSLGVSNYHFGQTIFSDIFREIGPKYGIRIENDTAKGALRDDQLKQFKAEFNERAKKEIFAMISSILISLRKQVNPQIPQ